MSLEWWQAGMLMLVGAAAGWINVLAGGGSLLTVPAMIFLGLPGPVANGTNRIAVIAQNVTAVFGFFRRGFSDFKLSASLSVAASIGAYFGANLGVQLDGVWFDRLLAGVMIAVMVIMIFDKPSATARATEDHDGKPKNVVAGHLLMIGAGFWGGFIQIAVGFLLMPILYRVMGLDLVRVNMHKIFIALIFSIVALVIFASKVEIAWAAGAALAVGNAIGGFLGAKAAVEKGAPLIRRVLLLALAGIVIKLLFF